MRNTTATLGELVTTRAGDDRIGLVFGDVRWTWAEYVQECARRAALLGQVQEALRLDRPLHVGVLLENTPEFAFLLGAGALSGAVVVGLNTTRRGDALARDVQRTDCDVLVSDAVSIGALNDTALPVAESRVWRCDQDDYERRLSAVRPTEVVAATTKPSDLFMLIFTSGTSGEPKAVRVTHRKIAGPATVYARSGVIGPGDVSLLSMPMFHSACVSIGWAASVAAGATMVLRRRFSASAFIGDVRRYGITYFHYVGKALSYVLATPPRADDHLNPLRIAKGNEASEADADRFSQRFACEVSDGFGSTEGGVVVLRTPDTPRGALGRGAPGVEVRRADTKAPTAVARFDDAGRLVNPDEAIGELVNVTGPGAFEGYYEDPEADGLRFRDGWYWSGDLAFRDENGFIYFAGRTDEWLRVDGENLTAGPIERVMSRFEPFREVAVYGVPDTDAGDQVMLAALMRPGETFDAASFTTFLGGQKDLSPKAWPRYVRVASAFPRTSTNKIVKRQLRADGWWAVDDELWWRPHRELAFQVMTAADKEALRHRSTGRAMQLLRSQAFDKEGT